MYLVTKLSQASQTFINQLGSGDLTQIALAKAIANKLPLPSQEVTDASEYFATNCSKSVKESVSTINELIVVDTKNVLDMVATFFKARLATLFPADKLYCIGETDCESDFFGYSSSISPELLAKCKTNSKQLVMLVNGFTVVLKEIASTAV